MNTIKQIYWYILGIYISGYKIWIKEFGPKLLGMNPDHTRFFENFFGLKDPDLDSEWDRIPGNNEPKTHTLTNIVVEWNRLDAQRGAKFFGGIILLQSLIILGFIISLIFS